MGEVKFELPDPAYEAYSWVLQDEHGSASAPPLLASLRGREDGPGPPRSLRINGFRYSRPVEEQAQAPWPQVASSVTGEEITRDQLRQWRADLLPEVERVARALESFWPKDVAAGDWARTLDSQEVEYRRINSAIHQASISLNREAANRFSEAFVRRFGAERSNDVLALLQGIPNLSFERACAIWELGRLLARSPELAAALDVSAAMPDTPAGQEFRRRFEELIERFGDTSNAEMEDMPTWREDHLIPLAAIRAYGRVVEDRSPVIAGAAAAAAPGTGGRAQRFSAHRS